MENIARFLRRIIFSYKQNSILSNWKTYLLFDLIPPILQTLFFSLVAYYIYGPEYIRKWMIGNVILIVSFNALFGVGTQLMFEKYQGTLSLLIASRTKLSAILLSSAISSIFVSVISILIGLISVSLILSISWNSNLIYSIILVLLLATFVSMSFGYIFSCFILLTSEVNLILNLFSRILLIFTGANFPIDKLPKFVQLFSHILPLTRSIYIAQGLMEGKSLSGYNQLFFEEVSLGIIFLIIAVILLKIMETRSRKYGDIEFI